MLLDCAIIGGGPAGLNAALVLGRAKRKIALFDDNKPRNAVTQHSHGFLTRDGAHPAEFRAIGQQEIAHYPSVEIHSARVESVRKQGTTFELESSSGERYEARSILLATGVQEILPAIEGIHDYYGKSLFGCPFCDGWELRDKPLVILVENEMAASHLPRIVYNWSHDLVVCTNGHQILSKEQKLFFEKYGIGYIEEKIVALAGQAGQLVRIVFENHPDIERAGGFVGGQWKQATTIGQDLGCERNALGGIVTDKLGRTTIKGVYAADDTVTTITQAQLIMAAASGSRAGACVIADLMASYFDQ
jgi:thioredoxin reductase